MFKKKNVMRIVKFDNGTYGIRKGSRSWYEYADLRDGEYYWWQDNQYRLDFNRCQGTLEQVKKVRERYIKTEQEIKEKLKDKGRPI